MNTTKFTGKNLLFSLLFALTVSALPLQGNAAHTGYDWSDYVTAKRPDFSAQEISQGRPDFSAQEISQGRPDFSAQEISQGRPDFSAQEISQGRPDFSAQGYEWSW